MTETVAFQRARRPEQKAQRRAAILDAARRLALENGVRNVSLGDIAKAVGLTKSNVLRYFETREEIYLRLTEAGFTNWSARVLDALPPVPGPAEMAAALTEGLAADPLFCDLLSDTPTSLEHNVSTEAARSLKYTLLGSVDELAAGLVARPTGLNLDGAREVVSATLLLASGLWNWCNPPPLLDALYTADPVLASRCRIAFAPELRRLTEALITGLVGNAP